MKKKYAVCGLSERAMSMYIQPICSTFAESSVLVGLLDIDPVRFDVCRRKVPQTGKVPTFGEGELDGMIEEAKPDCIIVTGRDSTHAEYVVGALEHDVDVICEKPMVTTSEDAVRVLEAERQSKGELIVTFNYRYAPIHRRIRRLIAEGSLGRVVQVDLNWYIDTRHGSSYFMRWNRQRRHSGGLSIHKACHHFDLVQWWIGQRPTEVFAYTALNYYGPESEYNPAKEDGRRCSECRYVDECVYVSRWSTRSERVMRRAVAVGEGGGDAAAGNEAAGHTAAGRRRYTGYSPDACIFDSEIDTEDTYTASIRYDGGAFLSYSANFSCPYEGYTLAINGTRGRLETKEYHAPDRVPFPVPVQTIDYFPLFGSKETIHVVPSAGEHGGGDPRLLEDLFLGPHGNSQDRILAGGIDGAYAVAAGEAVVRSAAVGCPIRLNELLELSVETNRQPVRAPLPPADH